MAKTTAKRTVKSNVKQSGNKKGLRVKFYIYLFIVVAVLGSFAVFIGNKYFQDISNHKIYVEGKVYELKGGATVKQTVIDLLKDDYPDFMLSLWSTVYGRNFSGIQKGKYYADGSKSLTDFLHSMQKGEVFMPKTPVITLVEGMTLSAFLKRVESVEDLPADVEFEKKISDPKKFLADTLTDKELEAIGGIHDSLEGLLFPATYPYFEKDTDLSMIKKALKHMASYMEKEWPKRDKTILVKDPYDALILASIIERESSIGAERNKIAAVFYNRLKRGMMLQTDPAVMYGVSPDFKGPLTRSQLRKDTPYNTYTRAGLTPTPISMPGAESILAALHPEKSDALYFVAKSHDPKDGHIFSNSLREHNKAVSQYRKKVRDYRNSLQDK